MNGRMDGWTDGWMDGFPLYSTGLHLHRFPPEPLPCSNNCYHYKLPEQGNGTDDHLLPFSDWFSLTIAKVEKRVLEYSFALPVNLCEFW